jgi:DUF1680 family protein
MLKLTRHIFAWTADPAAADYYERALFNGILGTMNPRDGMTMYYVPLASDYWKMFGLPRESFWCCTGTGVENFSKLQDSIYFHDGQSLFVNLFIPSTLDWSEKGVTVRQETKFPDQETSQLVIRCDRPTAFDVRIRNPYWAVGMVVKVNGKPVASDQPIHRTWKTGDRINVTLPMKLHTQPMPDDPGLQAFLYGPLVLAGRLGSDGLTADAQSSDRTQQVKSHFVRGEPKLAPQLIKPAIKPVVSELLTFHTTNQKEDVTLIPLNRLFGERYAVYWRTT